VSLNVSTLTPLDEPTLRISLPSSASSRVIKSSFTSGSGTSSSTGSVKSGFRSIFLNASAMIAASAPLNGPVSVALPGREMVDAPSCTTLGGIPAWWPVELWARADSGAVGTTGDCCCTFAIIGEAEPIEFLFESIRCRLRSRRRIRKKRRHMAAMAKKPSTTITAMAQCGKPEPVPGFCRLPVWVDEGTVKLAVREDSEAREADARETEAADAEDAAAADDDDSIDERIESAYVVSGR
jgi:hypothetical protein